MNNSSFKVDTLIVEDDVLMHNAFMKLTSRMGLNSRGVRTHAEARLAIDTRTPQLLLTDWNLGHHLTGIDVANYVVKHNEQCQIIFCTGNCIISLKRQTVHLNNCRFLHKPIALKHLKDTISDVLIASGHWPRNL